MGRKISRRDVLRSAALGVAALGIPQDAFGLGRTIPETDSDQGISDFVHPHDDARPWVYWYFMDGNLRREGMDADLIAMKQAGIGGAIYLEVGIGIKPGPIEFMSDPWQQLLGHAFEMADQLGLQMALGAGPGWCGAGGPWVQPDKSMQHLVASKAMVQGPAAFNAVLLQPPPRTPFFGVETLSPELLKIWQEFYQDEFVLAFPTPVAGAVIEDIDEKALYTRGSYSSQIPGPFTKRPWVRPFLPSDANYGNVPSQLCVASSSVIDLTGKLSPEGRLSWNVPAGSWTIMRFGRTITGQTTRPSPRPGLGLESDKFDAGAMDAHFDAYIAPLLKKTGAPQHAGRGLVALHFDSWEMSSQNWSPRFQQEFKRRRGYDPLPMLPTFGGLVVDTPEVSERFLWDIRKTASELVCENQAQRLRERGKRYGLFLELEPYDLNPSADLDLGATADVPMAEFWSQIGDAPPTSFSLPEAASVGHTHGHTVIAAEAFTGLMEERGRQHPASMKAQGDWAFCQGMNKFVIHRYQAQPWLDRFPGMTMGTDGGYGVHWERTQTWWDFVSAYHLYLTRCAQTLRRGLFVADILYLSPEGAPNVFFPPRSAFRPGLFADHHGHNFDACAPATLMTRASVKEGSIVFPDGMSYRLLVLPRFQTMTPRLLAKIIALVEEGATVVGAPPQKSPSLSNYPDCDHQVRELAAKLWPQGMESERKVGFGRVVFDAGASRAHLENPLTSAQWIWSDQQEMAATAGGTLYFTREFSIEDPGSVETAVVTLTADQSYHLSLNGRFIASGHAEARVRRIDISSVLRAGANRLTVAVKKNSGQSGLIASLEIEHRDGRHVAIETDKQWTCSATEGGSPSPATELGAYNMAPWKLNDASIEQGDIYPSYLSTAELLER
ncbi:MAG TPA: glycosyl hydrolase, partial [Acidobacteriaceae bacterium]|nr:glycosyl hydrolase [Acidobacteriaceae bacterium]